MNGGEREAEEDLTEERAGGEAEDARAIQRDAGAVAEGVTGCGHRSHVHAVRP
ncbi:hypothetical protein [Halarchaeum nitratireducens]|uniref:Uncharacterized protein n=1 Tax=Halarchaeum nitratireducens TaxID=489913 RepID=A0A830G9K9_9EURY|nr:hypothetical protein [Halarchaeum nitratireducens]GGN11789.1 hypothetical protein GCM10009021_09720 [Halarchaeum nitratireducens]